MSKRISPLSSEIYHGRKSKRPYFEGWYFKHTSDEFTFSVIPGVHYGRNKQTDHCFIQILTQESSHYVRYPIETFRAGGSPFAIKIGKSSFSLDGIKVDIDEEDITMQADLGYTGNMGIKRSLLWPTFMGPFAYMPGMQCSHDVLSMYHSASGQVEYNGKSYGFSGEGYIEKDRGTAFPNNWIWLQANRKDVSFMCSIATVPYSFFKFTGVIAYVYEGGKEYRFATYNCSKTEHIEKTEDGLKIILTKPKYRLIINAAENGAQKITAPTPKTMDREIFESLNANISLKLYYKNECIMERTIENGGMEISEMRELDKG